jgi:hypothetical protein
MTTRCRVGDLAVFVPPAEAHLLGVFVTVLHDEGWLSRMLGEQIWTVRTRGAAVPDALSGKPIRQGIAFDFCLKPIRPSPSFEEFQHEFSQRLSRLVEVTDY